MKNKFRVLRSLTSLDFQIQRLQYLLLVIHVPKFKVHDLSPGLETNSCQLLSVHVDRLFNYDGLSCHFISSS